ncbi:bromodomain-containing protein [Tanacetum coccineum]|uniref:Bromodomain-containing protein n=1 Tax=Tanacetum coccineum TaxID=301880 RepID=A0ABQ5D0M4_9ASTR
MSMRTHETSLSFIEEDEVSVVVKPSESQSSLEETMNSVAPPASTRKLVLKFSVPKKEPTSQNTPTRVKVEEESARPVSENPIEKWTTNGHKSTKIRFKPNVKLEHDVKPVGECSQTKTEAGDVTSQKKTTIKFKIKSAHAETSRNVQNDDNIKEDDSSDDATLRARSLKFGHQEYIESRNSQERGPWMKYKEKIKDTEICLVDDIKYKSLPGSGESCCKIRLIFIDPLSKVSDKHFELTLPELVDDPDFLVEKTRYDSSLERDWSPGDRCSVWWNEEGGGCWWDGRIVSISDKSADFPGSQWERFNVEYDADDVHRHSPWELHDKDSEWEQTQAQPMIDFDTRKTMLSLFAKLDQSTRGNQDKLGIMKLRQTSERPDFINTFPVPLTLEIIELRIKNSYYLNGELAGFG